MRQQFRAVAAAMGITYEMLTGDLTQVNYSSIRAGLLEFRRRCEALQHGVIVHQLCRPIWRAWMDQAVLEGALPLPGYSRRQREYQAAKWIPQGWQWVDPQKEFNAMKAGYPGGPHEPLGSDLGLRLRRRGCRSRNCDGQPARRPTGTRF
jgi:lambda family phage portal protein